MAGVLLLAVGAALFHLWGNATHGYLKTDSLFVWWGAQWLSSDAELEHGPLVVLGAFWLLYWIKRDTFRPQPALVHSGVWTPLASSLALHGVALWVQQPRLSAIAWILFLGACLEVAWGRGAAAATRGARWFLLFALPFGFIDTLGWSFQMRLAVATVAHGLCGAIGIPLVQNGTLLQPTAGGQAFEVAAACAGLRSLTALTALAVFLALWRRLSVWRGSALVLVAWGAVAVGNLLRVCATVLTEGRLHEGWGLLVFVLESALIFWLADRWESQRSVPEASASEVELPLVGRSFYAGAGSLVLAAALVYPRLLQRSQAGGAAVLLTDGGKALKPMTELLDSGWLGRKVELTRVESEVLPPDTLVERRLYSKLGKPGEEGLATLVLAGLDRSSLHRPELCLNGTGWGVQERATAAIAPGIEATLLTLSRKEEAALMLYWFAAPGRTHAGFGAMVWDGVLSRLRGRSDRWAYYSIQVMVRPGETRDRALARATELAGLIWRDEQVR